MRVLAWVCVLLLWPLSVALGQVMPDASHIPYDWDLPESSDKGYQLLKQGFPREAKVFFQRRIHADLDGSGTSDDNLGLALALQRLGRYEDAERLCLWCLKQWRLPSVQARANERLAMIYWDMGRLGQATQILASMPPADDPEVAGANENNHGLVLMDSGDLDGAARQFEAAFQHCKMPRNQMLARNNLAILELRRRHPLAAEAALASVRGQWSQVGDAIARAEFSETDGQVLLALGRHGEAVTRFQEAVERATACQNLETMWHAQAGLGRAYRALAQPDRAVAALQAAVATIGRLQGGVSEGSQTALLANKQDVFVELMDLLARSGNTAAVLKVAEQARNCEWATQFVLAGSRLRGFDQNRLEGAQDLQARQAALSQQLAAEPDHRAADELREQLRKARVAFASLADSIDKERDASLAGLVEINPPDLSKLQTVLPPGTAVLEPVPLADRLILLLVTRERLYSATSPIGVAGLRQLVGRYRALAQDPRRDARVHAQRLYGVLLEPLEPYLRRESVGTLLVSPGGCLRYLPFAALWDGHGYLVERMAVGNLTRAGQLALARAHQSAPASVLALADPDGSLPGARTEVRDIASVIPARTLVGEKATVGAFEAAADGAAFLHLATHGVLSSENPRDSYLLLADQGRVTYGQIPGLPLTHTEMVTLSACQTAVGMHAEGGEIYGLAYQFEKAGAATVVATLWSVSDASTAELMKGFYSRLRSAQPRAQALRQAQLALLRGGQWSQPFFWAPFILIGDAR